MLRLKARAAGGTGRGWGPRKNGAKSAIDSSNTVGLTALMRMPRGISIAAAIANASMAASTMLADEPATIGVRDSTPAISVIEPWSLMCSRAASARLTWPMSLSVSPNPYEDLSSPASLIADSGRQFTAPAAQATASNGPAAFRPATMLAGLAMSMRMSPAFDPADTMSWRGESSATIARPSTPLAPTRRMRRRCGSGIFLLFRWNIWTHWASASTLGLRAGLSQRRDEVDEVAHGDIDVDQVPAPALEKPPVHDEVAGEGRRPDATRRGCVDRDRKIRSLRPVDAMPGCDSRQRHEGRVERLDVRRPGWVERRFAKHVRLGRENGIEAAAGKRGGIGAGDFHAWCFGMGEPGIVRRGRSRGEGLVGDDAAVLPCRAAEG